MDFSFSFRATNLWTRSIWRVPYLRLDFCMFVHAKESWMFMNPWDFADCVSALNQHLRSEPREPASRGTVLELLWPSLYANPPSLRKSRDNLKGLQRSLSYHRRLLGGTFRLHRQRPCLRNIALPGPCTRWRPRTVCIAPLLCLSTIFSLNLVRELIPFHTVMSRESSMHLVCAAGCPLLWICGYQFTSREILASI